MKCGPCGPAHESRRLLSLGLIVVGFLPLLQGSGTPLGILVLAVGVASFLRACSMGVRWDGARLTVRNFFRTHHFHVPISGSIELVPMLSGWPISAHARIRLDGGKCVEICSVSVRSFGPWNMENPYHRQTAVRLGEVVRSTGLTVPFESCWQDKVS